jgi:hypothetical protein
MKINARHTCAQMYTTLSAQYFHKSSLRTHEPGTHIYTHVNAHTQTYAKTNTRTNVYLVAHPCAGRFPCHVNVYSVARRIMVTMTLTLTVTLHTFCEFSSFYALYVLYARANILCACERSVRSMCSTIVCVVDLFPAERKRTCSSGKVYTSNRKPISWISKNLCHMMCALMQEAMRYGTHCLESVCVWVPRLCAALIYIRPFARALTVTVTVTVTDYLF